MTIINPNSISGITSFTAEADVMNFYKSNGTLGSLQLNGCNFNTTNGISTFNNLVVGGTLTYEDVKNVDSVGIVTARAGITLTGGVIKHTGQLKLIAPASNSVRIRNHDDSDNVAVFNIDGSTHLYYDSSHKFSTVSDGIDVVGNILMMDSLTHRGDTNTKIRFPADDTVTVETAGSERLRIDSSGRMGLGTNAPGSYDPEAKNFVVSSSDHTGITIASTGSNKRTNLYFADGTSGNAAYRGAITYDHASDYAMMRTAGLERLRIDSSGRLLIASDTSRSIWGANPQLQIEKLDSNAALSIIRHSNTAAGPWIALCKSRGTSNGAVTIVQDGDSLGSIDWFGADGGDLANVSAEIKAEIDGTPGSNDLPGRLLFKTTADGAASPTERLRITSDGNVQINQDSKFLQIGVGQDLDLHHNGTNSYIRNKTGNLHIRPLVNEEGIILKPNGAVELYHDNSLKVSTTASGARVHDQLQVDGTIFAAVGLKVNADNQKIRLGASDDLELFHNGSNTYISNSTGNLMITGNNSDKIHIRAHASKQEIICFPSGAVQLFYNDAKKFETTDTGASITGALNSAGATFGDYNVETNRTSGSSKGFYVKRGGTTVGVLANHGTGPEGKMELYNNGTLNLHANGTAGTIALNGYIRFGISNGAGNQLDDYEEGSFTPQPWSAAGSISYSHAGDARQGRYTKIGNLVYFVIRLQLSSVSTANGQAFIIGLPFTASSRTGGVDSCHAFNINFYEGIGGLGGDTSITGRVASGQSYILLQKKGDGSSASSYSANDWSGNWSIYGSGCYHTDS